MTKRMNRMCEECETTRANYGLLGEKPTHCAKCKEANMIYLTFKKCVECNVKEAKYNELGKRKEYCIDCKKDDMVYSDSKICIKCNNKSATYGKEKGKLTHCIDCREEGMINQKSRMCIECKVKLPLYGYEDDEKANYCKRCKKDGMVDITSKKCEKCGVTRASFGFEGQKETHCSKCKTEDMENVRDSKCIDCKKNSAVYGLNNKRTHCGDCKTKDMLNCANKKCITCKTKRASFNIKGEEALYCEGCKKENMVNVRSLKCKAENCFQQANKKYKYYCSWCFQHLFPEDPLSKQIYHKTLKTAVAIEVLNRDSEYKHDKPMFLGGCNCLVRRRVDFWKIIGNTILAIEVDENQHKKYSQEDENIRYNDLYMAFSGKWVFIRFNPNNFKKKNGKLNKMALKDKIPVLINEISKHEMRIQEEQNNEMLEIHKLFFDEV